MDVLKNRNLPHLIFGESQLAGPRVILGQRAAARKMTEELLALGHRRFALMTGYDVSLDAAKRAGVHEAFREAGIDPQQVPEFSVEGRETEIFQSARKVLELRPRPTAVIAFDDSLGSVMNFHARRQMNIRVPEELSIVGFHDWPFLSFVDIALTTVHFDFFAAGQKAAEALSHAALTGQPVSDITFEPCFRPGQTIGPAPAAS